MSKYFVILFESRFEKNFEKTGYKLFFLSGSLVFLPPVFSPGVFVVGGGGKLTGSRRKVNTATCTVTSVGYRLSIICTVQAI